MTTWTIKADEGRHFWDEFLALMDKNRPKRRFIEAKNEELHRKTGKYATVDQLHAWAAEFDGRPVVSAGQAARGWSGPKPAWVLCPCPCCRAGIPDQCRR